MGLDIYFHKRRTLAAGEDGTYEEESVQISELAYFRKVNCLVAFFEYNYDYSRDTWIFPVTKEMCKELCISCKAVLKRPSLAGDLMPTVGGFFFGSQEYDDSYLEDLEDIIDQIEEQVIPAFDDLEEDEYIAFVISW